MLLQGLNTLVRALDEELCVHQYSDFVCVWEYGPWDSGNDGLKKRIKKELF